MIRFLVVLDLASALPSDEAIGCSRCCLDLSLVGSNSSLSMISDPYICICVPRNTVSLIFIKGVALSRPVMLSCLPAAICATAPEQASVAEVWDVFLAVLRDDRTVRALDDAADAADADGAGST